jgi:hypothetical protein
VLFRSDLQPTFFGNGFPKQRGACIPHGLASAWLPFTTRSSK